MSEIVFAAVTLRLMDIAEKLYESREREKRGEQTCQEDLDVLTQEWKRLADESVGCGYGRFLDGGLEAMITTVKEERGQSQ